MRTRPWLASSFSPFASGTCRPSRCDFWSRDEPPLFLEDPWRLPAPILVLGVSALDHPIHSPPSNPQHCIRQHTDAVFDRDEHGRTPLILAAAKGQADALRALASGGGQVNVATRGG